MIIDIALRVAKFKPMKILLIFSLAIIGSAIGWYCDANHMLGPASFYFLGWIVGFVMGGLIFTSK